MSLSISRGRYLAIGKLLPGLALSVVIMLLRGPSFFTLAWSTFACSLSCSRRSSMTGGLSWFLAGIAAFIGSSPGGMVCLAAACILEINLRDDIRQRAVPFLALLLVAADGSLTGMTSLLLGCAIAMVFDGKRLRYAICAAWILAGIIIQGPPSAVSTEDWPVVRFARRWQAYDWHDTLLVDRSQPRVNVYCPSRPGGTVKLNVTSHFSSGNPQGGWIQQGSDYHSLVTGTDTVTLKGRESFSVVLPGEWRPFSPDEIGIRWI